jgi:aspartate/methionine/tyrosine aminotransferase
MAFFRAALEQKVITVPGEFFDINPGKRRRSQGSRFRSHVRFSFGPGMDTLERALERLEKLVSSAG